MFSRSLAAFAALATVVASQTHVAADDDTKKVKKDRVIKRAAVVRVAEAPEGIIKKVHVAFANHWIGVHCYSASATLRAQLSQRQSVQHWTMKGS